MGQFLVRRFLQMIVVLVLVTFVSFVLIELPPGDYLSTLRNRLQVDGVDPEVIEGMVKFAEERYGLGDTWYSRLWRWVSNLARGDLGYSMRFSRPNSEVIGDRLSMTMAISVASLLLMFIIAVPVGMLSAIKQYSMWDHLFTVLALLGVATPSFIMALVFMFVAVTVFHAPSISNLFSPEYVFAPWSLAKFVDLLKHMWIVVVIVGASGTAGTIRVMRARMLDTLSEPYMDTARAKGLSSAKVYFKHGLRVAINPIISSLGMRFPSIISGSTIVAMVLTLPTVGPVMLEALRGEDIYLACSILLLLTVALVIGNFLADLTLAWLDPRIRHGI